SSSSFQLGKMYYQQYNMYKQGWYGYQPQQYLSCMHEEQGWLVQQAPAGQIQEPVVPAGQELWEEPHPQQPPPIEQPQHRVPPPRSPFEWMKKPSYQSQPTPGKTRTKDKYRVVYTDHQRLELEKEFH
ncbi:caudal, partial [Halyomorpha halys]